MSSFPTRHFEIAIIGSGPAAYAAAAYSNNSVLFEGSYSLPIGPGGQLTTTSDVDNYPGFVGGTKGYDLMQRMRDNCSAIIVEDEIVFVQKNGGIFRLYTDEFAKFSKNLSTPNITFETQSEEKNQTLAAKSSTKSQLSSEKTYVEEAVNESSKSFSNQKNLSEPMNSFDAKTRDKSSFSEFIDSKDFLNQKSLAQENVQSSLTESFHTIDKNFDKENSNGQFSQLPCLYTANVVIIATGANAKRLYVPGTGDHEFWQKGISTCAVCDGYAFLNKKVVVIGGGDSAMEEALYLANIAKEVVVVHRSKNFRARVDMLEKVRKHPKITMLTDFVLKKAYGDSKLKGCIFQGQDQIDIQTDGLFFAIGHIPNTGFLKNRDNDEFLVDLDKDGFIITDHHQNTSMARVLAAGDVQDKIYRQAITAAASGARAGLTATKLLKEIK